METELQKIDNRMQEIAYDILNIGETITTLIENETTRNEILWQIDSLSTAVGKCCKELTETCNEGLEILFQHEAKSIKEEPAKEQLELIET